MTDPGPSGKDAWRVLYSVVKDDELVLAMRASQHPKCQWFVGWLDEVYYPWRASGRRGLLWPPARQADQFFPLINEAIAAARRDMEGTAAEFARLWPPAWPADLPDEPMLPGADDRPMAPAPPRRKRSRTVSAMPRPTHVERPSKAARPRRARPS